jgi:hypothetical protein
MASFLVKGRTFGFILSRGPRKWKKIIIAGGGLLWWSAFNGWIILQKNHLVIGILVLLNCHDSLVLYLDDKDPINKALPIIGVKLGFSISSTIKIELELNFLIHKPDGKKIKEHAGLFDKK